MSIATFIFARGGSKGISNKNIKLFNGKPLIAWSIELAKKIPRIKRVIVSTDSAKIANIANKYGAETPFLRPANLANDHSHEWDSYRHALRYLMSEKKEKPKILLSLPCTSPLRKKIDIEKCIDKIEKNTDTDAVVTITDSHRNPYFNMVKKTSNGNVSLVCKPKKLIKNRQEVQRVYDLTTVAYAIRVKYIFKTKNLFSGKVKSVYIPIERSLDIDNIYDFEFAEFLLKKKIKK